MVKFGRKFFFDTKHSKKRRIVTYIVIGVAVILLIIILALIIKAIRNKKPKTPVKPAGSQIVLRSEVETEIYAPLPDKTVFFEKIENFDINDVRVTYPDYLPLEPNYDECTDDEIKLLEDIKNGKDVDANNADACVVYMPTGIGAYDVTVNYNDTDYTVTLNVTDTKAPTLVVKQLEITEGDTYQISDFVESCVDNSKKECSYEYYYKDYNSKSDFSKYTEPGTYEISIVALDGSGRTTVPEDTKLIIKEREIQIFTVTFNSDGGSKVDSQSITEGEKAAAPTNPTKNGYTFGGWYYNNNQFDFNTAITSDITLVAKWNKIETKPTTPTTPTKPTTPTCSNGDLTYDANKYPYVALYVTDGNCAISKSDLTSITYGNKATLVIEKEKQKLRKWQDANGYNYYWVVIGDGAQGVPNTSGKGYVGYTIQFSIAKQENGNYIEIARYFLDKDGKRHFSLNTANMPES